MFKGHDESSGDVPGKHPLSAMELVVELEKSRAYAITETHDRLEGWPILDCFWDLRMVLVVR